MILWSQNAGPGASSSRESSRKADLRPRVPQAVAQVPSLAVTARTRSPGIGNGRDHGADHHLANRQTDGRPPRGWRPSAASLSGSRLRSGIVVCEGRTVRVGGIGASTGSSGEEPVEDGERTSAGNVRYRDHRRRQGRRTASSSGPSGLIPHQPTQPHEQGRGVALDRKLLGHAPPRPPRRGESRPSAGAPGSGFPSRIQDRRHQGSILPCLLHQLPRLLEARVGLAKLPHSAAPELISAMDHPRFALPVSAVFFVFRFLGTSL